MAVDEVDDGLQSVRFDEFDMCCETLMAADTVFCSADGPVMNHRQGAFRMRRAECCDGAAPHAAAHDMGFVDVERIEQSCALADKMVPGNLFHPAAGLAVLTPVEQDASVSGRKVVEQLDPFIHPEVGPLFNARIESAR